MGMGMFPDPRKVASFCIASMNSLGAVAGKSLLLMALNVILKLVGLLMSFGATVRNTLAGPCRCVKAIDSAMDVLCSIAPNPIFRPDMERTGRI